MHILQVRFDGFQLARAISCARCATVFPAPQISAITFSRPHLRRATASFATAATLKSHLPDLPKRVLVVDDDAHCAALLTSLLKVLGHTAVQAAGAAGGVEMAKQFQPDVVLWTLEKPDRRARDRALALQLRESSPLRRTHLVALASWKDQAAADSGFDLHLSRPVQLEEIDTLLRTL
jgi:CheY-like chemotaxis protein